MNSTQNPGGGGGVNAGAPEVLSRSNCAHRVTNPVNEGKNYVIGMHVCNMPFKSYQMTYRVLIRMKTFFSQLEIII
jgi:hypothetical protein